MRAKGVPEPGHRRSPAVGWAVLLLPLCLVGSSAARNIPVAVSSHEAAVGDTITAELTVDMTATSKAIGSIEGRLTFEPSVTAYVAADRGSFEGLFEFNSDSVSNGYVRFAGVNAEDDRNDGSVVVLRVHLMVVGGERAGTPLTAELGDLTATDFTPLLKEVVVTHGMVAVAPGG